MSPAHSVSSNGSEPGTNKVAAPTLPAATESKASEPATDPRTDDEAAAIAELNAAMAANPDLRAITPQPAEWEDYATILAQNPEIANPVPGTKKEFYMCKDRWECGHDGEPIMTDIERDISNESAPAFLINDLKEICEPCLDKWRSLESGINLASSSSSGPNEAPALPFYYYETWEDLDTTDWRSIEDRLFSPIQPGEDADLNDDTESEDGYVSSSHETHDKSGSPPPPPPPRSGLSPSVDNSLAPQRRPQK